MACPYEVFFTSSEGLAITTKLRSKLMDVKAREYLDRLRDILTFVETKQAESISTAAKKLSEAVARGGIIYTFGSGHSHCAAEDIVYRAGGLAAVSLIYEP